MYRCGTWIIKKAEHWRMAAFNLWCWRRLLSVPWTVRRSNQLVLKEINPEYSYWIWICWSWSSGHWMEKTLMLERLREKEKGATEDEIFGWHQWLSGWFWTNSGRQWRTRKPGMLQSMGRKESDVTDQLNNNSKLKLTSVLIWASQVTLGVKNPPTNAGDTETLFRSLGWEDPLEEGMATHSSIFCLENSMGRGVWQATIHGAAKSRTWLSTPFQFSPIYL